MIKYKILHLEDDSLDAELVATALTNQIWGAEINHVLTNEQFLKAVVSDSYDVILLDYSIPEFEISQALASRDEANDHVPIIIVSGAIDDVKAVEALKLGVTDYVLKDKLFRLIDVVGRAIENTNLQKERDESKYSYEQSAKTVTAGFYKTNDKAECKHANEGLLNMVGDDSDENFLGLNWMSLVHEDDRERVLDDWKKAIATTNDVEAEMRLIHKNGSIVWIMSRAKPILSKQGILKGYFGVAFDITKLKEAEFRLQELSYYDTLTQLPNRRYFQEFIEKSVSNAKRYNERLALFFVDIDNFKQINDTKGHPFGDKFLELVGERFQKLLRPSDFIARQGGDEFVLVMNKYSNDHDVLLMAERIMTAFSDAFLVEDETVYSTVSVGVAMHDDEDDTAENLLQRADLALYRAKSTGKANYKFYSEESHAQLSEQFKIKNLLVHALDNNELYLEYQPQVYAKTKE